MLLFSCSDAKFTSIPGQYQDMIPSELYGNYRFISKDAHSSRFDSLFVQISTTDIKLSVGNQSMTKLNHNDFQIHKIKDWYVLGFADKTFRSLYNLMVLQPAKDGLRVYFISENNFNINEPTIISKYMEPRDLMFHHEPLIGQPSIADGGPTPPGAAPGGDNMIKYYITSEEQFRNYFDLELKDKDFVFLARERGMRKFRK